MKFERKVRWFCAANVIVIIFIVTLILAACGGGGGGGEVTPEGDGSLDISVMRSREVSVNPSESYLYGYTDKDGSHYSYFGNRDADGLPLAIKTLVYVDADGKEHEINYNNDGMPFKIRAKDGSELELVFHEDENTVNALSTPFQTSTTYIQAVGARIRGPRINEEGTPVEIQVTVSPTVKGVFQRDQELVNAYKRVPFGNVHISVSSCGQMVNPAGGVKVHVGQRHADIFNETFWAFPSSTGRYVTSIPQIVSFSKSAADMCDSFASLVSTMCNVTNDIITSEATAKMVSDPAYYVPLCSAMALKAGPGFGHVNTICIGLFSTGLVLCETIGRDANPGVWEVPMPIIERNNIAQEYICPNAEGLLDAYDRAHDLDPAEHYKTIQAAAYFDASDERKASTSDQEDIALSDTIYPELSIAASESSIDSLTTSTDVPEAGKGYAVTAELSCVEGEFLSIAVTRDDASLITSSVYSSGANGSITVDLPGEPEGTMDEVRVSSMNPSTGTITSEKVFRIALKTGNDAPDDPGDGNGNDGSVPEFDETSCPASLTPEKA